MSRRLAVLAAVLVLALAALPSIACAATTANASQVAKALDYLHACQRSDGGFAEKGASSSSDSLTSWAIVAIAAAGEDPNSWLVGSASPVGYLSHQSSKWSAVTDLARTTLAVVAARKNPSSFGGVNLVAKLRAAAQASGSDAEHIGPYVNSHVWAMIALKAAGETPSAKDVTWLTRQQNSDGGWGWASQTSSDTNDTAAALEALAAAGVSSSSSSVKSAIAYLRGKQLSAGGFGYSAGSPSDANSTSWVVQGIVAAGQNPASWTVSKHDPYSALTSLQGSNGALRYSASQSTNTFLCTVEAIPALCGRAFPIGAAPTAVESAWRPIISATWPANGASVTLGSTPKLTFSVSDGAGTGVAASAVSVKLDGKKVSPSMSGGTGSVSLSGAALGEHSVAVTATDRAGNKATLSDWKFTIDAASAAPAAPAAAAPFTGAGVTSVLTTQPSSAATGALATSEAPRAAAATLAAGSPLSALAPKDRSSLGLLVAALGASAAIAIGIALLVLHRRRGQA
jgi:hypothetical protein